jgi:hypothetical protein
VQLFAEIADDGVVGIEMFDLEMFTAYLNDWRVRVCEIGTLNSISQTYKHYIIIIMLYRYNILYIWHMTPSSSFPSPSLPLCSHLFYRPLSHLSLPFISSISICLSSYLSLPINLFLSPPIPYFPFNLSLCSLFPLSLSLSLSSKEIKSSSADFDKRYKELTKLRVNFRRARETYEKKMLVYNDTIAQRQEVISQLILMKAKLQEVKSPLHWQEGGSGDREGR